MQRRNPGESLGDYLRRIASPSVAAEIDLAAAKRENEHLHEQITKCTRQNQRLRESNQSLRTQLRELRRELDRLRRALTEAHGRHVTESLRRVARTPVEEPGQIRVQSSNDALRVRLDHLENRINALDEKAENPALCVLGVDPAGDPDLRRDVNWLLKQVRELNAHLEESRSAIPALEARYAQLAERLAPVEKWPGLDQHWNAP